MTEKRVVLLFVLGLSFGSITFFLVASAFADVVPGLYFLYDSGPDVDDPVFLYRLNTANGTATFIRELTLSDAVR
jgi:hypothetical protein